MRILMVSSYLPFPLFSGGHIRLYNIIKELSQKHAITLICEIRNYQTERDILEIKKYCDDVILVPRRKQWSIKNMLHTGFSSYPFLMIGHTSWEMREKIYELIHKKKYDLIHVETFYVMQNIPKTSIPTVLVEHNIEHLVYRRFVTRSLLPLRPVLFIDVLKMRYWEESFWEKADKLIAVSEDEKKQMRRSDVEVIPNGVDVQKFVFREKRKIEKRVLFIGDFKWIQNRDSLSWILKEIWPLLQKSGDSNLSLRVVGRNIPDSMRQYTKDASVVFEDGSSIPTEEIFQKAFVLLAPIRIGGGTSFKILEAFASGLPVITTKLGIEGIEARDGKEVLIGDSKNEIVDKLKDVSKDESLYRQLAKNARKLVEEKYDWRKIVDKLEKVYNSALSQ